MRPSRTAQFVALGRAIADAGLTHVTDFHDPTARVFLSARGKRAYEKTVRAFRAGKSGFRVESARVMGDTIALRTAAIDAALRDAVAGGARQLVILGAGYDGRAWRLPELAGVNVFEVDQPATQNDKRAHRAELRAPIGNVTFVPVNFERESLDHALEHAGHDRTTPTCWIWEGVVMYLTRDAMRATLADVAGRSAPGSTLIVNYHAAHRRIFARLMFRLIGEPQISAWSTKEMAADLRAVGYVVHEDSSLPDWNDRFAHGRANVARLGYMRLATARREP